MCLLFGLPVLCPQGLVFLWMSLEGTENVMIEQESYKTRRGGCERRGRRRQMIRGMRDSRAKGSFICMSKYCWTIVRYSYSLFCLFILIEVKTKQTVMMSECVRTDQTFGRKDNTSKPTNSNKNKKMWIRVFACLFVKSLFLFHLSKKR